MLYEVLLSSLWFIFIIFWAETISVWLFLSILYHDLAIYHWGNGVFAGQPLSIPHMMSRIDALFSDET